MNGDRRRCTNVGLGHLRPEPDLRRSDMKSAMIMRTLTGIGRIAAKLLVDRASRVVIAAAFIAVLASSAQAGDQGDPERSCDGNTFQMVECLKAKTEWVISDDARGMRPQKRAAGEAGIFAD